MMHDVHTAHQQSLTTVVPHTQVANAPAETATLHYQPHEYHRLSAAAEHANQDRMILPEVVADLEQELGIKFDIDLCADKNGVNSLCARFCCAAPDRSLFVTPLVNETCWMNPPFVALRPFVSYYLQQKEQAPELSACILVPDRQQDMHVHQMVQHLQLVRHFPPRTTLFSTPTPTGRRIMPPCPFGVKIYYDPPAQQPQTGQPAATPEHTPPQGKLSMLFRGLVDGFPAHILLDSGATHSFIDCSLVQELDLQLEPVQGTVTAASGHASPIQGCCHTSIQFKGHHSTASLLACTLTGQFRLVLGDDWLSANGAHLNFAKGQCTLQTDGCRTTMHCKPADSVDPAPNTTLLSATQLKAAARHGADIYLVHLHHTSPEAPAVAQLNAHQVDAFGQAALDQTALQQLLDEYTDVFPEELPQLETGRRNIPHTIPLEPGAKPPCRPMYRLSQPEMQELRKQLKELLDKGYIEPSTSPFGAPILFVKKKDGSMRMCIDYRALNKVTIKNKYPLPRIDDLLDSLSGSTCFSSLDLKSGYWQLEIAAEDKHKSAFRTPFGHYQFKCLSMGLTNAPSTYQNVMNDIFREYLNDFVLVYLDDILVYSRTPEEHLHHIQLVLQKLRDERLYASRKKCDFGKTHLEFVGHIIGADGVRVDPKKTAVVDQWPKPADISNLRSFLGLANYFRKFIKNYSTMVAPLTSLTKKNRQITDWDDHCDKAFQAVKDSLTNAPVLASPDFNDRDAFQVHTDASIEGLGAALLQHGRPVAYMSRKLNAAERNYTTTEQECLAVIEALREWRCYLEGAEFNVYTDHQPLTYMDSKDSLSRRQVRWAEELQRYNFKWNYKKGATNVADPLSRLPTMHPFMAATTRSQNINTATKPKPEQTHAQKPLAQAKADGKERPATTKASAKGKPAKPPAAKGTDQDDTVTMTPLLQRIMAAYARDPWYQDPANTARLTHKAGLWWQNGKLMVPADRNIISDILREAHDAPYSGHLGVGKTLHNVKRYYQWPNLHTEVKQYVLTCDSCQRMKSSNQKPAGAYIPLPVPSRNWESISMDLVTDLPTTPNGNDSVIVFVDRLSKMVHIAPCTKSVTATQLAAIYLREVARLHGFQKSFIMDRDTRFTSQFFLDISKMWGTKLGMSTAFHPQTDGQTERMNRTLEDALRHYVSPTQTDWDTYLSPLEFAINNAVQESTKETPFVLNCGQHPLTPLTLDLPVRSAAAQDLASDIQRLGELARRAIQAAQDRTKDREDTKRRFLAFNAGDLVLLNTKNFNFKTTGCRKLTPRWCGPFAVLQAVGLVAYRLELPPNLKLHNVFHVNLLKRYHQDSRANLPPPPELVGEDLEYDVQEILQHRRVRQGTKTVTQFLVQWLGYPPEHNTWEPQDNLDNCPDILAAYWARQGATSAQATPAKRKASSTAAKANNKRRKR
jgi:hypothetical protein